MLFPKGLTYIKLVLLICLFSILNLDSVETFSFHQPYNGDLELVHVIFRHGDRTPEKHELYPKDPYLNETYFPFGNGQLTNPGKRREYEIGRQLRWRYNDFLGPYYFPNLIDPWTTDYNRTKMSLELVLAYLFKPTGKQIWNYVGLNWQPIPFNYLQRTQDKVLLGSFCPKYVELYNANKNSLKQQQEYNQYKEALNYISENSGLNATTFETPYNLMFGLTTEQEWGFKLPKWTKNVWPEPIVEMAIKEYYVTMANTGLRQLSSGYHIQKIVEDTKKKIKGELKDRKMILYSAHENNIAQMLILLDVFKPHVPPYGSYLILEVHKIDGVYGIKIFYQNYSTNEPELLKMPACDYFCPLDKFVSIVEEYFPAEGFCGNKQC